VDEIPEVFDFSIVQAAMTESAKSGRRFIPTLEESLGFSQSEFMCWLGKASGYDILQMEQMHAMQADFSVLPFSECVKRDLLPLREEDGRLVVVLADPFSKTLRQWAWHKLTEPFGFCLGHHSDIQAYFTLQEDSQKAMEHWKVENEHQTIDDAEIISLRSIAEDASPVIRIVHSTLYDALKANASDIHLETGIAGLIIKYRIDGVLHQVSAIQGLETAEQIISRLKVMSELDIAERRIPQDGRFKAMINGRQVDFRISIMPNMHGEDAVLRILDRQNITNQLEGLRLDALGFDQVTLAAIRRMSREPYGMLLVTGPTGSGKTTTLYAAISEINEGYDKIITIEDPVEYQVPGILQIPVNEKKGLTFARGLRSILRHDPDKIMVGEIRDTETAQIAIQSALTGHLVFTTVHANNVFDVISRFAHMGVDPYSFVTALNGILAQRLVRVICPDCSVDYRPEKSLLDISGLNSDSYSQFAFRIGRGCGKCRGSGFYGRKSIAEILILNDELREMIASRQSIRSIKELALRQKTRLLRESALELVRNGETTLQEINRVTFVT
jgi:general secretion pathway protein E